MHEFYCNLKRVGFKLLYASHFSLKIESETFFVGDSNELFLFKVFKLVKSIAANDGRILI